MLKDDTMWQTFPRIDIHLIWFFRGQGLQPNNIILPRTFDFVNVAGRTHCYIKRCDFNAINWFNFLIYCRYRHTNNRFLSWCFLLCRMTFWKTQGAAMTRKPKGELVGRSMFGLWNWNNETKAKDMKRGLELIFSCSLTLFNGIFMCNFPLRTLDIWGKTIPFRRRILSW